PSSSASGHCSAPATCCRTRIDALPMPYSRLARWRSETSAAAAAALRVSPRRARSIRTRSPRATRNGLRPSPMSSRASGSGVVRWSPKGAGALRLRSRVGPSGRSLALYFIRPGKAPGRRQRYPGDRAMNARENANPDALFARPDVAVERRPDGTQLARSTQPLGAYSRCVGEWLVHWATETPERTFLAERQGEEWRHLSYAEAQASVLAIGSWLLANGLGPERPLVLLSDNSIAHGLLSLAAMHVGIPAVPVSPAYSLMSRDHAKLRTILAAITPGAIHAAPAARFAPALAAIR